MVGPRGKHTGPEVTRLGFKTLLFSLPEAQVKSFNLSELHFLYLRSGNSEMIPTREGEEYLGRYSKPLMNQKCISMLGSALLMKRPRAREGPWFAQGHGFCGT